MSHALAAPRSVDVDARKLPLLAPYHASTASAILAVVALLA